MGSPGADPFVRGLRLGTPWAIRQQNATPDLRQANRELLEDLEGGATELLLITASAAAPGIPVSGADDLDAVLDGVYLDLAPVALAGGTEVRAGRRLAARGLAPARSPRGRPARLAAPGSDRGAGPGRPG